MTDSTSQIITAISQKIAKRFGCDERDGREAAREAIEPLVDLLDAAQELYGHTDLLDKECCLGAREDYATALANLRATMTPQPPAPDNPHTG